MSTVEYIPSPSPDAQFQDPLWKVVPLSKAQLLDVRPEDILGGGLYRLCDTYRGGGGYDQFPDICAKRLGKPAMHRQFVVQLYGCHLDCPYCYVTRAGVWGEPARVSTTRMLNDFDASGARVFHLMGGAPALHMTKWPNLLQRLASRPDVVFHSDLLLTERRYAPSLLSLLAAFPNALYAVDIKGLTNEEHLANTRRPFREEMFWDNLRAINEAGLQYYITFTNVRERNVARFWSMFKRRLPNAWQLQFRDAFSIGLVDYNAIPFVDSIPWGGIRRN